MQATDAAREILGRYKGTAQRLPILDVEQALRCRRTNTLRRSHWPVIPEIVRALGLTTPTVTAALQNLERIGIVREVTRHFLIDRTRSRLVRLANNSRFFNKFVKQPSVGTFRSEILW